MSVKDLLARPDGQREVWPLAMWPRKPGAPPLPHPTQAPKGYRPPNGLVWGHTRDEFLLIPSGLGSGPAYNVSMWSRSMIKEYGELYTHDLELSAFADPWRVAKPRRLRPWPVLRLKGPDGKKAGMMLDPPLGVVDEGSDNEGIDDLEPFLMHPNHETDSYNPPEDAFDIEVPTRIIHIVNVMQDVTNRAEEDTHDDVTLTKPVTDEHRDATAELSASASKGTAADIGANAVTSSLVVQLVNAMPPKKVMSGELSSTDDSNTTTSVSASNLPCSAELGAGPLQPHKLTLMDPVVSVLEHSEESSTMKATAREAPDLAATSPELDPFNRRGIPKLEENIPPEYFPDTLIVHDTAGVSMARDKRTYAYRSYRDPHTGDVSNDENTIPFETGSGKGEDKGIAFIYKRVYPDPGPGKHPENKRQEGPIVEDDNVPVGNVENPPDASLGRIAHLHLSPSHSRGIGSHSHVYLSPLTLPEPLSTFKSSAAASARPGTVLVAAKLAIQERNARQLLAAEAATYDGFPRHLSDDYCGVHLMLPIMHSIAPSTAVVPKFFGYYTPVYDEHEKRNSKGKLLYPWQKRSPILLMEDCGEPINIEGMNRDARSDCFSLVLRLHAAKYLHGSFHERNIVVQPGPLTFPPGGRELATPSFRVIDFGRTKAWSQWGQKNEQKVATDEEETAADLDNDPDWISFSDTLAEEWREAKRELRFWSAEPV